MARETAVERRARIDREAREAESAWREALPMRVLEDMARASKLGFDYWVVHNNVDETITIYFVKSDPEDFFECKVVIGSQSSTRKGDYSVGLMLDQAQIKIDQKLRQEEVRKHALSKLTTEEREALGL